MLEVGVHMRSIVTQLPNDCSLFPTLTRFGQELADGAANAEIVFLSEEMKALAALAINQDQCWGTFHFVGAHREWTTTFRVGSVDTNRKSQPIFINENRQRFRRHDIVVFKYRVQTGHSDIGSIELPLNTLRLWNAMMDAAGAQHLEGMQHNHLAAQRVKIEWARSVEPLDDLQRWSGFERRRLRALIPQSFHWIVAIAQGICPRSLFQHSLHLTDPARNS